jgi:chromosome segregation ATPase
MEDKVQNKDHHNEDDNLKNELEERLMIDRKRMFDARVSFERAKNDLIQAKKDVKDAQIRKDEVPDKLKQANERLKECQTRKEQLEKDIADEYGSVRKEQENKWWWQSNQGFAGKIASLFSKPFELLIGVAPFEFDPVKSPERVLQKLEGEREEVNKDLTRFQTEVEYYQDCLLRAEAEVARYMSDIQFYERCLKRAEETMLIVEKNVKVNENAVEVCSGHEKINCPNFRTDEKSEASKRLKMECCE